MCGLPLAGGCAPFVLYYSRDCRRAGRECRLDTCANRGGGPPRKPLPRKKIPPDLKPLARGHTELCIKVLARIVSQEALPPAARVSAAGILLDRGWGRGPQAHTGQNGEGDIRVIIRHIVEGGDSIEQQRTLQIEAVPNKTHETDGDE
jgi:hypothetical protein